MPRPAPPPPLPAARRSAPPRRRPAALLWGALSLGCLDDDPVLVALPDARPATSTPGAEGARAEPAAYARPAGAYIDAPHLLRTRVAEGRDTLLAQLGPLLETQPLPPGQGQLLRMERGALRVIEQRVYMLQVPLPEPTRRMDVFSLLGLPPPVGEPIQTHRDFRYHNERGTRLIRLVRQAPDNELITEVEVWDLIPGEHGNRRR